MCSEALGKFHELIREDNRWPSKSKKHENERKDLLFWFVDNCPSKEGPEKAKGFNDYGIIHKVHYSKLKKQILKAVNITENKTYKYCKSGEEMEKLIDEIVNLYRNRHKATIFFSKGEHDQMDSLFIRIRNSFAHGNYFIKGDYYILWNETGSKKENLGAFMMLKYEHLREIYLALGKDK